MPRGRRPRVATATLPPKGYYAGHLAPLIAVREGRVSPAAGHLWSVIRAYAWQDGRCDLTDRELAVWMGGLGVRQIRNLRVELSEAGLLMTEGGERGAARWLAPQPAMEGKPVSGEIDFTRNAPLKEEEVNAIELDYHPPPPPGDQFPPNVLPVKRCAPGEAAAGPPQGEGDAAVLAAFLAGHGAFPPVAAGLAQDLLSRMALAEAQAHSLALLRTIEADPDVRLGRISGERARGRWVARLRDGVVPPAWAVREAEQVLAAGAGGAGGEPTGRESCDGEPRDDEPHYGEQGEPDDAATLEAHDAPPPRARPVARAGGELRDGEPRDGEPHAGEPCDGEPREPEARPWIVSGGRACCHRELWDVALTHLRLQLPGSTFDNWLAGSCCSGVNGAGRTLMVQVRDRGAAEWLTARLKPKVLATLVALTGQGDLDVRFEAGGGQA